MGDISMNIVGWMVLSSCLAVSAILEGIHGKTLFAVVLMGSWTLAAIQGMAQFSLGDLTRMARSRSSVHELLDTATSSSSMEDGLESCLPLIPRAFPTDHIVAYLRSASEHTFSVAMAWPEREDADADIPSEKSFRDAVQTHHTVIDELNCVVPVGHTTSGELVIVISRAKTKKRSMTFVNEMCDALASTLLRMSGRVALAASLKTEGQTDPLTGLPNRWALEERLQSAMEVAELAKTPVALAMVDIDHFKEYNDTFGHPAGDTLLSSLASLMMSEVRPADLVARYGGEEFCFVMPDTDLFKAVELMEHVRVASSSGGPDRPSVTISVGVTIWDGKEQVNGLLQRADVALYSAKESGRDRVVANGI
jgi:diguanylate cyclase (GGDEF)-like protein